MSMSKLIEYLADVTADDDDGWLKVRAWINDWGVPGLARTMGRVADKMLDEEDPEGVADRKITRDRRKAARDARRKARDEVFESEPYGPEAMDGSRRVTAEDRAFFAKLYPDAVLPEFFAEKVQRKSRPAPVTSAITIKDIYPDAAPVRHAPGDVTKVII